MKFTSIGILFTTLLMGFVIGFLTNGYFVRQRIGTVREFTTEEGYNNMLMHDLGITDSQKQAILPLVKENFELIRMINQMHYADLKDINDSLYAQIAEQLNNSQKSKLENKRTEFKETIQKLQPASVKKNVPSTPIIKKPGNNQGTAAAPQRDTAYHQPTPIQIDSIKQRPPKQQPSRRIKPLLDWENLSEEQKDSIQQFKKLQRQRLARSNFDSLRNSAEWNTLSPYQKWWLEKQNRERQGDTTAMPPPPRRWNEQPNRNRLRPPNENDERRLPPPEQRPFRPRQRFEPR